MNVVTRGLDRRVGSSTKTASPCKDSRPTSTAEAGNEKPPMWRDTKHNEQLEIGEVDIEQLWLIAYLYWPPQCWIATVSSWHTQEHSNLLESKVSKRNFHAAESSSQKTVWRKRRNSESRLYSSPSRRHRNHPPKTSELIQYTEAPLQPFPLWRVTRGF